MENIINLTKAEYETAVNNVIARYGENYSTDQLRAEIVGDAAVYGYGLHYYRKTETETGYRIEYETYSYCD